MLIRTLLLTVLGLFSLKIGHFFGNFRQNDYKSAKMYPKNKQVLVEFRDTWSSTKKRLNYFIFKNIMEIFDEEKAVTIVKRILKMNFLLYIIIFY